MRKVMYINPWRKNRDGTPHYQKSEPRLKSAFADRRKKRIHSRSEFRTREVLSHIGNVFICYTGGFFGYDIYSETAGIAFGAANIVDANAIAANCRIADICNGCRTVGEAVGFGRLPMPAHNTKTNY